MHKKSHHHGITKTLDELKLHESAFILEITAPSPIKERLIGLGFIYDRIVKLKRKSAGSQTFVVQVGANSIALRKEEAKMVIVTV
jgi:Fe2+ transport system protein FeoA